VDRSIEIRTPESVAFEHHLAGIGSRFLAVVVDMVLQAFAIVAFLWILSAIATQAPHPPPTSRFLVNLFLGLYIFVLFTIVFGYYILFEAFWHGQTPGKRLLGIRVVRDGGYPIDFSASLIRNIIRIGEWSLGFYAIAAISALLSLENKRVGDFAAGTIVVRDARIAVPPALAPDYAPTTVLSGEERALVHRFIERRTFLSRDRRTELAAQLAKRIRPRVAPELAKLDDESLLERL
jgi:uncharacterized RDD family membrane protein YckC